MFLFFQFEDLYRFSFVFKIAIVLSGQLHTQATKFSKSQTHVPVQEP